ncbi:VOC family protein [Bacillus andreraoultii]|uniref:VOC family protein n=1 Tax=Bacillus andreraoultii TaxID=1499685 RepID=UPI00053A78AD|nr:VOC family protein [Bacillus andreraoultii]
MGKFHESPNLYINQVSIKVANLERSITFYKEIIGLQLLQQTGNEATLTADGKTPLLHLYALDNVMKKTGRTTGLYHFAILLPTRGDLSVFLRHLIQTQYPFAASDHLVSEAIYLVDPDENGIEVYCDRSRNTWKWSNGLVHMDTLQLNGTDILGESTASWAGLPNGTTMGHIHLHVHNLESVQQFYVDGLGFDIVSYYPQAVFLSSGKYHHHIAINTWAGVNAPRPSENSVGLKWYSIKFPNEVRREEVVKNLIDLGIVVERKGNLYITRDPSNNLIHLSV